MQASTKQSRLNEGSLAQVAERLVDLFPRIHYKRTVACNGFVQWLAGNEQEARRAFAGGNINEVARAPNHEQRRPLENLFLITVGKLRPALKEVSERRVTARDKVSKATVRRNGDIQIGRICRNSADGTLRAIHFPRDHPNTDAIFSLGFGDLGGEDILVPWRGHF